MLRARLLVTMACFLLAGVTALGAYGKIAMRSTIAVTVVQSDEALLVLSCGEMTEEFCGMEEGRLTLHWGSGGTGFQPGTLYQFDSFIDVANQSNHLVSFGLDVEDVQGSFSELVEIRAAGVVLHPDGHRHVLLPGSQVALELTFRIPDDVETGQRHFARILIDSAAGISGEGLN